MSTTPPLGSDERAAALAARHGNPTGEHVAEQPTPPRVYDDVDGAPAQPDPGTLALEMHALANAMSKLRVGENTKGPSMALPSWLDFKLNIPILMAVLGVGAGLLKQLDSLEARTAANTAEIADIKSGRAANVPLLQAEIRRGDTQDERLKTQADNATRLGLQVDVQGQRIDRQGDKLADVDKRVAVMEGRASSPREH